MASSCGSDGPRERALGHFVLDVDPATRTARFGQSLYSELPFAQDGDPNTNPAGTIQAVTTSALFPGQGNCPATANCFRVVLRNFTGDRQHGMFMGVDEITPPTGRAIINSDELPPGVSAPGGGRAFGDLADAASTAAKTMNISIPDTSPYHLKGSFWGDDTPAVPAVAKSFDRAVEVDGTEQFGVDVGAVTFAASDFPTNAVVDDVNVEIVFHKTAGTCARPTAESAFHSETSFRLESPTGTRVVLARSSPAPSTWAGAFDHAPTTVTFDQAAPAPPSDPPSHPVGGLFQPHTGDLSAFNGERPEGAWTLQAGDAGKLDPLCVQEFTVTVHAK